MSLYSHEPHAQGTAAGGGGGGGGGAGAGVGGGAGGGGGGMSTNDNNNLSLDFANAGSLQGMGMLDTSAMTNGLDIDMSMPMDLDLDLSQHSQNFAGLQPQQQQQDQHAMTGAATAAALAHAPDHGIGGGVTMDDGSGGGLPSSAAQEAAQSQGVMKMSGAGAGPLPTGFGMPLPNNSTSTLTEFTKRRNWSQRVIEELKDFLHILTPDGRILYVSPSCKSITGYEPQALIGKFMAEYVHPDDSGIFMREFNESIASGNSLRFFYRFKKEDGTFMIFECDGHPHISPDGSGGMPLPENSVPIAGVCRGFFMMARPYPTKNAALLDSFLEHKIENERLMKRIEELKSEEMEENAEQERLYREHVSSPQIGAGPATAVSESQAGGGGGGGGRTSQEGSAEPPTASTPNYQGMPPPAKPPTSNTALTRQNLDSALSAQKPDSIADKMSRYEANSTHLESIELLTGLRYRDGERSHGISTGDTSPALIRGDAGIAILVDRDRDGPKKDKKKLKVADEYVCADCGTLDSPEWRKGPKGPKTLCNACGLRWAKKEKKRGGDDGKNDSSPNGLQHGGSLGLGVGSSSHPPALAMGDSTGSG